MKRTPLEAIKSHDLGDVSDLHKLLPMNRFESTGNNINATFDLAETTLQRV